MIAATRPPEHGEPAALVATARGTSVHPVSTRRIHRPRTQHGMSLIEVLVSVLIFSFGLLGLVALQARATQFSASAEDTTRASLMASEVAAAMWAARNVCVNVSALQTRAGTATDPLGLPNGVLTVNVPGYTSPGTCPTQAVAEITITWLPTRAVSAAENRNRYTTQVSVQ